MYLRTIYELVEEGIVPLRARIAERLHQSGPTVSQTVARMERDGLVTVEGDRHLELTDEGMRLATRVMRKHRLAERLLIDVIGLDWELVHDEACRWEHVMSETVERRLRRAARPPDRVAVRQPDPGPRRARREPSARSSWTASSPLSEVRRSATRAGCWSAGSPRRCRRTRSLMSALRRVGALPDKTVTVVAHRRRACWSAPAARPPRSSRGRRPHLRAEAVGPRRDPGRPGSVRCADAPRQAAGTSPNSAARSPGTPTPDLELVRRQLVAAGRAAVDDHHRGPRLGRPADEPEAAHHGQRRAGAPAARRRSARARRRPRSSAPPAAAGTFSPKNTTSGLSDPPHARSRAPRSRRCRRGRRRRRVGRATVGVPRRPSPG